MKSKRLHILTILCALLTLVFLCLSPAAYAAEPTAETMAASLRELGLFLGTDRGFELDKPCDRLMGAVILTRLLGQEEEAQNGGYSHPFTDVSGSYASPYIGYLYQHALSNGISAEAYGREAMTGQQFAALILRALGYRDEVDFRWDSALTTLANLGIISRAEAELFAASAFLRASAVTLCHRALTAIPKDDNRPLIYRLLWEDVFSTRQLARSKDARLLLAADMPDFMGFTVTVYTEQEFTNIFWLALHNRQSNLSLYAPWLSPERAKAIIRTLFEPYFVRDFFLDMESSTYNDNGTFYLSTYISEYMSMQFYYQDPWRYQKNYQLYETEYQQYRNGYISMYLWQEKINSIVAAQTSPEMSEYERAKALHDYLVLNTVYDTEAGEYSDSHFADAVLFNGIGVCDGFASAFKMLLNGAGIESLVVFGSAPDGNHAWNQVKIDGEWYNVDITWANTIGAGSVYYGYFCVPDNIFLRDHRPEKDGITYSCTATKYYLLDSLPL